MIAAFVAAVAAFAPVRHAGAGPREQRGGDEELKLARDIYRGLAARRAAAFRLGVERVGAPPCPPRQALEPDDPAERLRQTPSRQAQPARPREPAELRCRADAFVIERADGMLAPREGAALVALDRLELEHRIAEQLLELLRIVVRRYGSRGARRAQRPRKRRRDARLGAELAACLPGPHEINLASSHR